MKNLFYTTLVFLFTCISCHKIYSQDIKTYKDYEDFHKEIMNPTTKKRVVNFWALYCKPCMEEMPYFIEAFKKNKDPEVEFIWVSLDFNEKKLKQFALKNGIIDQVVWLKAPKQNKWIPRVHKDWEGPIPITLFISGDKKILSTEHYKSTKELNKDIKRYLTKTN